MPSKFELVGIVSYNCPVFISQDDCQQVYLRSETAREKFSRVEKRERSKNFGNCASSFSFR